MRRRDMLAEAARSTVLTYSLLVLSAIVTMLLLRAGGPHFGTDFVHNDTVHEIRFPPAINLVISACGAVTGIVMIASGRFTVLAGPVVALQLLPAAATIGEALELGDGNAAAHGLERLVIDAAMVIAAGLIYFGYKHV
jgi:uncharacterized membrane protein YphA (DoxX/SURF4 family)